MHVSRMSFALVFFFGLIKSVCFQSGLLTATRTMTIFPAQKMTLTRATMTPQHHVECQGPPVNPMSPSSFPFYVNLMVS